MTSRPERNTEAACNLTAAELESQQRANAPTLRDLHRAAQGRGFSVLCIEQAPEKPAETGDRTERSDNAAQTA